MVIPVSVHGKQAVGFRFEAFIELALSGFVEVPITTLTWRGCISIFLFK
jgi:hypothetical protein